MSIIPWREHAILIRTTDAGVQDGGRAIVAEAPLHRVVDLLATLPAKEVERHYIALPDRHVPPFRYEAPQLSSLLGRIDRPGAISFVSGASARRS